MIEASCHCGAVRIDVEVPPAQLTSCNCSLCRRLGTLWAYYRPGQVRIAQGAGTTVPYIQGDRTLAVHHCPTCGCVTHWESTRSIECGVPDFARIPLHPAMMNGCQSLSSRYLSKMAVIIFFATG